MKAELQRALDALGPNGEHWSKGGPFGVEKECAISVCGLISGHRKEISPYSHDLFGRMGGALDKQLNGRYLSVIQFNDAPSTTFADVKALFERAIAACED